MNERIRELAEQAWVYQVRVLNEPDGSRTYTEKEKVFDKEKFAELIVRECIQRLIDHSPARFTNEVAEEEWDKGYDQAMEDSVNHIKKHFGVEQ